MNRIQFFVLIGLSALVTILLIAQIFLERQSNYEHNRLDLASQEVNQGQAFLTNLKQLATRIEQVSQTSGDPGLKELLARNQISYTPNAQSSAGTSSEQSASPAPSSTH